MHFWALNLAADWWHLVLLKASGCHFQEGIGICVILSLTTDTVSETLRRRFESCPGHITIVLRLMTVVMLIALRLISSLCTRRMITDGKATGEHRKTMFL